MEGRWINVVMGCRVLASGVSLFEITCRRYDCIMDTELSATLLKHVGTHGALLQKVGYECIAQLEEFADVLVSALRSRTPLNVVAFCIGGEKWSVALATVLFHCAKGLIDCDPAFPQHLCSCMWHRTCRGNCEFCRNALHSDVVRNNPGVAFAVARCKEILLKHIPHVEVA